MNTPPISTFKRRLSSFLFVKPFQTCLIASIVLIGPMTQQTRQRKVLPVVYLKVDHVTQYALTMPRETMIEQGIPEQWKHTAQPAPEETDVDAHMFLPPSNHFRLLNGSLLH